ncbi:MAG: Cof-type HAD-IIB family hydrolase [Clostridia bacterium]|nr:Cof-type HAD-IIB family hydrolase [Clostridia bacterium]
MTYKYVVSDLDGTLLNEQGELSPYTLEVLGRLQDAGVGLIVASGRVTASVLPLARAIGTELPIITGNGAVIADGRTGAPLIAQCLPQEDAVEAALALEAEGHYFHSYSPEPDKPFYCSATCEDSAIYSRAVSMEAQTVGKLSDFLNKPQAATPKLLAVVDAEVMPGLRDRLRDRFAGRLTVTNSTPHLIEITRHGVNKGAALLALCTRLGVEPARCIAFGDGGNDKSLLAVAGLGIAVKNAQPSLLAMAAKVCGSNEEDGVARYLAQWLLGDREERA